MDEIEQSDRLIQQVPGVIAVPPVFVGNVAVFYTKNAANQGSLTFYNWSTYTQRMELKNTVNTDT